MDYEAPEFFDLMAYVANADHDVIDMVSGNPDWGSPPSVAEGLHTYADRGGPDFQYPPTEGLGELRREIADRRDVSVDQVVVTVGGGEANYLGFAMALEHASGEEALLTDPVYPYYPGKVSMLGGTARYIPADDAGRLDPDTVREYVTDETALVVANTPNNPTGAVYDQDTMAALVEAAEDHDAMLVSDEAYDHFDFSGRFTSALHFDSANRIVTNSYSKTLAITGFRVGYAVFPTAAMANRARDRHMLTLTAGNRPAQAAVLHALRHTDPDYYEESRAVLRDRVDVFTDALETAGAEFSTPDGGFYVMARFEGLPGTTANVKRVIDEAGVAGMPGDAFGTTRADWFRFALVSPRVSEAADRLAAFFE
ncbi:MAG: pyridoxal phosphate-dependent aminotransferase [Halobacteriales archaeon]|nr:pyridoxal phosphate-dependent aminotransferase [Halobacteriales archaeon]